MARFLNYDYEVKVLVVGDSGSGKTCLLLRLTEDCFPATYIATVGVDVKVKIVEVEEKQIKLQIWDTAGQERYNSLAQSYYRTAEGVLIAFDCTDEASFNNVTKWLLQIQMLAEPDISKVLICTKCDRQDRAVSVQQGEALARELEVQYFETSALGNVNVVEALHYLAKEVKNARLGRQGEAGIWTRVEEEKRSCC